jgi:hypothetical protein
MATVVLVLTIPRDDIDPQSFKAILVQALKEHTHHEGVGVHASDFKGPLPEWAGGVLPSPKSSPYALKPGSRKLVTPAVPGAELTPHQKAWRTRRKQKK